LETEGDVNECSEHNVSMALTVTCFYIFQLLLDLSSLQVGRQQNTADRNSDASE
jgi:hypothetical protein